MWMKYSVRRCEVISKLLDLYEIKPRFLSSDSSQFSEMFESSEYIGRAEMTIKEFHPAARLTIK